MNGSNIKHAFYALGISLIAFLLSKVIPAEIVVLFAGALYFLGREMVHTEIQIMEKWKLEKLSNKVILESLKIWKWEKFTLLDFLVPLIVNLFLALLLFL